MRKKINRLIVISCFFVLVSINFCWPIEMPYLNKAKIRLSIAPGQSDYGEIIVENPSSQARSMRIYLEDWYYLPAADGSKAFVPINSTPFSCASWITFSPGEFTIAPFSRQRVSYSIAVPPQAEGGYYAVLFFETTLGQLEAGEEGIGAGINLAIRIGALFYVEAEGTIRRTATIEDLNLKRDTELSIQADIRNTGNVDITAGGTFHIMDKQGMVYARGEFNDVYTFPKDTAKLISAWGELLPEGRYDLILTVDLGKAVEEAGMGRGPVMVKEAEIEIGADGQVIKVGELK